MKVIETARGENARHRRESEELAARRGIREVVAAFPPLTWSALFCLGTGQFVRFALDLFKRYGFPLAPTLIVPITIRRDAPGRPGLLWMGVDCGLHLLAAFTRMGSFALLQHRSLAVVVRVDGRRICKTCPERQANAMVQAGPTGELRQLSVRPPASFDIRLLHSCVVVSGFRTEQLSWPLRSSTRPSTLIRPRSRRVVSAALAGRIVHTAHQVHDGSDIVRCQSPELIDRKIWMQAIANNLFRAIMSDASLNRGLALERLNNRGHAN